MLMLLKEKPLNAGEIANRFTFSFASIPHHLHTLEESGLVASKRNGNHMQYILCAEDFEEINLWINRLISE